MFCEKKHLLFPIQCLPSFNVETPLYYFKAMFLSFYSFLYINAYLHPLCINSLLDPHISKVKNPQLIKLSKISAAVKRLAGTASNVNLQNKNSMF